MTFNFSTLTLQDYFVLAVTGTYRSDCKDDTFVWHFHPNASNKTIGEDSVERSYKSQWHK